MALGTLTAGNFFTLYGNLLGALQTSSTAAGTCLVSKEPAITTAPALLTYPPSQAQSLACRALGDRPAQGSKSADVQGHVMALSALASAFTRELGDGHAHRRESQKTQHADARLEDNQAFALLKARAQLPVDVAGAAGTEIGLIDDSAVSRANSANALQHLGPLGGQAHGAMPAAQAPHLRHWLHDPSLYASDEASFALWHAKQKYTMDLVAAFVFTSIEAAAFFNPEVCDGIKAAKRYLVTMPVLLSILGFQTFCKLRYQQWREIILCAAELLVAAHVAHCGSREVAVRLSAPRISSLIWFPRLIYAEGMAFWCLFFPVRFRMACINQVAMLVLSSALPQQMCALIGGAPRCVTWAYLTQLQYGVLLPLLVIWMLERRARAAFREL